MFNTPKADVTLRVVKNFADGILPVGCLGAVQRPAREQGRQFRDSESVELILEDVIYPLQAVRNLLRQALVQALGDFAEENPGLASRIQKPSALFGPEVRRQQVQNLIRNLGRCKNLIAAQVGDAA